MSEEKILKRNEATSSQNIQNLQDKFSNLKREAYLNLAQALDLDAKTNGKNDTNNVIILYEKSLMIIDRGLSFYKQYEKDLSVIEGKKINFIYLNFLKNFLVFSAKFLSHQI